jgi:ABC-type Fe3+-hydroxamate transport system substrate-binding protein
LIRLGSIFAFLLALLPATAWPGDILLTQADGSELRLAEPAGRLVTLSPNLAELVFAAGSGDSLLATVEYSAFPPEAAQLPRVGDAFRLDIERIVTHRPDLVLAWDSGTPRGAVDQLRSLGITVWSIEIREPRQIAAVLSDIGRATASGSMADERAAQFLKRLEALETRYAGEATLDYFYQVDPRPLYTINGEHLISQGLALCGGHNVFADESGLAFQVAHESVIVADPDALIAPRPPGGSDPFAAWREWPGLKAVQAGALFSLDADRISQATPRWLDSIETACELLHGLRRE